MHWCMSMLKYISEYMMNWVYMNACMHGPAKSSIEGLFIYSMYHRQNNVIRQDIIRHLCVTWDPCIALLSINYYVHGVTKIMHGIMTVLLPYVSVKDCPRI